MTKKIFIILILLILLNFTLNDSRKLSQFEKIFNEPIGINKIFVKNKKIKIENTSAVNEEIEELKNLLELKTITSTFNTINATVIERKMIDFFNIVTIDKGKKHGIKKDTAVVTSEGLVGKIINVSNNSSQVKLITNKDIYNKISIKIEIDEKTIYGILSDYDERTNSFVVEGIDQTENIKPGDLIYTTGMSSTYPNGIKIGRVVRISQDNFNLSYILKIEPLVNFKKFHYVAVLDRNN